MLFVTQRRGGEGEEGRLRTVEINIFISDMMHDVAAHSGHPLSMLPMCLYVFSQLLTDTSPKYSCHYLGNMIFQP